MKDDKNKKVFDVLKNLTLIPQIGISVVTPIILGVYLGLFIDKKVGTNGVFTIILILIGTGAGFMNIIKLAGGKDSKGKNKDE